MSAGAAAVAPSVAPPAGAGYREKEGPGAGRAIFFPNSKWLAARLAGLVMPPAFVQRAHQDLVEGMARRGSCYSASWMGKLCWSFPVAEPEADRPAKGTTLVAAETAMPDVAVLTAVVVVYVSAGASA